MTDKIQFSDEQLKQYLVSFDDDQYPMIEHIFSVDSAVKASVTEEIEHTSGGIIVALHILEEGEKKSDA